MKRTYIVYRKDSRGYEFHLAVVSCEDMIREAGNESNVVFSDPTGHWVLQLVPRPGVLVREEDPRA